MPFKTRAVRRHASIAAAVCVVSAATPAGADEHTEAGRRGKPGWSWFARGGYVHQFDAGLDGGGGFDKNRFFVQTGPTWASSRGTTVALAIGYGVDDYDFTQDATIGGRPPWGEVRTVRLSVPVRWRVNESWSGFVVPTLRSTREAGAGSSDSWSGGGFVGFAYRFGPRLTLGPGLGVLTRLEDDADVFPVLLVNWKITPRLSLETGRALGATLGPGLQLNFQATPHLKLSTGARFERLRFRLDADGSARGGVGEDRSLPLFAGAVYEWSPSLQLAVIGGGSVDGRLRLDDRTGQRLAQQDYDAAPFLGVTFNARF